MEDSCVMNMASQSQSSLQIGNYYQKQNETTDAPSSQGTNTLGESQSISETPKKKVKETKKKIKKETPINSQKNQGHWTPLEHQIYVEFLEKHHTSAMQNQQNKKNNKIFKLMSQTIETRSPSQCRSHHQKFNPFTVAGQKRIKRCRKRVNATENQNNIAPAFDVEIKDYYYTPQEKHLTEFDNLPFEEYLSNYEDARPQLQNFCRNSLENLDCGSNFHYPQYRNYDCFLD